MPVPVAAVGECMIELNARGERGFDLAFGGDTLNTAVYLARAGGADIAVEYVTALGTDPYSDTMMAMWREEGLGTAHVARLDGKLPGLYVIRLDDKGERRFYYWRSASAARHLFEAAETLPLLADLRHYRLVYFSAITLSILSETARTRFRDALAAARSAGSGIAIDTNYRPAGWPDRETAARVVGEFLPLATVALPTADDDAALFGDADAEATLARYERLGVPEVAVKLGDAGCALSAAGTRSRVPVPAPVRPVDTTAAGDAFNGAYLAARLRGAAPAEAALAGHRMASVVIQHRGAIVPREATAALEPPT